MKTPDKYIAKLVDSQYILYKRFLIFCYKPMVFVDWVGFQYHLVSEDKQEIEDCITKFLNWGWLPHYENIMQRID